MAREILGGAPAHCGRGQVILLDLDPA
jgi:hypothetical protein